MKAFGEYWPLGPYSCNCAECKVRRAELDADEAAMHARAVARGDINRCVCRACLLGVLSGKLPDHELRTTPAAAADMVARPARRNAAARRNAP